jgi:DNA helicase HerA-like ATPase
MLARAAGMGLTIHPAAAPTVFWDLFGEQGHPIRATVSEMGPLLLARLLELNDVQEGVLNIAFRVADEANLPVLDLKDLRALLNFVVENADTVSAKYGNVAKASVASVQRQLLMLENQGADKFFGEPEFDTADLLRVDSSGRGIVSLLELPQLQDRPRLFSTFLMWLLADLFHDLPEVGDVDKPKLVFFFDEAHLLFDDASKEFLDAIAQTVRLIRSKGVGVFFVTQTPKDVPGDVLAQLANRVQHALRAFTPADAKALKATASTFPMSGYDLEEVLTQVGIGEAVVTVMSERGAPTPVAWTRLRAPQSRMAPADAAVLASAVEASPLRSKYAEQVDRDSAYERLAARLQKAPAGGAGPAGTAGKPAKAPKAPRAPRDNAPERSTAEKVLESSAFKQMARSAAAVIGREITRSIFGTRSR